MPCLAPSPLPQLTPRKPLVLLDRSGLLPRSTLTEEWTERGLLSAIHPSNVHHLNFHTIEELLQKDSKIAGSECLSMTLKGPLDAPRYAIRTLSLAILRVARSYTTYDVKKLFAESMSAILVVGSAIRFAARCE